jgi:hypothetical protein
MPPRVMSEVAHALERDDELLLLVRETLSPLSVAISSLGVSWPCPQILINAVCPIQGLDQRGAAQRLGCDLFSDVCGLSVLFPEALNRSQ